VNPGALQLRCQVTEEGVATVFTPQPQQEGYPGITHGGIITAVLDETIGWAVAVDRKSFFVTGELNVRFLRPLPIGEQVRVNGRVVEHKTRYSVAEGEIVDDAGTVYARAQGKFFCKPEQDARKVDEYLTYVEGDLNLLE